LGGHIILLNKTGTPEYEADVKQAKLALSAYPQGLQIGGGINVDNAKQFLDMGASHVIVTSYVFRDGMIDYDRLKALVDVVGKDHLVLDLSCKKKENDPDYEDGYYIVTDRWQKFTKQPLSKELLSEISQYADEFLVHAVDVEGKASGVEKELVSLLAGACDIPITYAGGVGSYEDIEELKRLAKGKIDVTIGSALDLFGGALSYNKVLSFMD
jgi:phosphoribosylformimino-5-aminoimidazole carboxamide ribotide isomerase